MARMPEPHTLRSGVFERVPRPNEREKKAEIDSETSCKAEQRCRKRGIVCFLFLNINLQMKDDDLIGLPNDGISPTARKSIPFSFALEQGRFLGRGEMPPTTSSPTIYCTVNCNINTLSWRGPVLNLEP